jgi:hypothetical protein
LAERIEIHDTAKQGSWLLMAEIELIVFTGQCLDRQESRFRNAPKPYPRIEKRQEQPATRDSVPIFHQGSEEPFCAVREASRVEVLAHPTRGLNSKRLASSI